jgi:hypothetical protein
MEIHDQFGNTYTARTWFQQKCADPDTRDLWIKARILYTFKKRLVTALYLFEYNMSQLDRESSRTLSQRAVWSSHVHHGIRILFDRIVTRWKPAYLSQTFVLNISLHDSLTPEPLHLVLQIFGNINLKET